MSSFLGQTPKPQFSLRGLLWFVVACSAYLSMIAAPIHIVQRHNSEWLIVVTILSCWLILLLFLRSKGVRGMVVAHCAVPGSVLMFVIVSIFELEVKVLDASIGLAVVCFVTSLVTFPASVIQMVVRSLQDKKSRGP